MIFFPGSTIGNFEPEAARDVLCAFREGMLDSDITQRNITVQARVARPSVDVLATSTPLSPGQGQGQGPTYVGDVVVQLTTPKNVGPGKVNEPIPVQLVRDAITYAEYLANLQAVAGDTSEVIAQKEAERDWIALIIGNVDN